MIKDGLIKYALKDTYLDIYFHQSNMKDNRPKITKITIFIAYYQGNPV